MTKKNVPKAFQIVSNFFSSKVFIKQDKQKHGKIIIF
jgi:hypothetical protein